MERITDPGYWVTVLWDLLFFPGGPKVSRLPPGTGIGKLALLPGYRHPAVEMATAHHSLRDPVFFH